MKEVKSERILQIYNMFLQGQAVDKAKLSLEFGVNERTIQRDIDDIRAYFASDPMRENVIDFDRGQRAYLLKNTQNKTLSDSELLAVCKILLESRSMIAEEMLPILDKLIGRCVTEENRSKFTELILNEKFHYIEPHHGQPILDRLWALSQAVQQHKIVDITYERMKEPKMVSRKVQPVGIMFSEYYFYLTAFLDDKSTFENPDDQFPTIYRIDRIKEFKITNEHFSVPYQDRFQEGEFRKRVQFMYGGKLQTVKFTYSGPSVESVLDRLPTARILDEKDGVFTIEAEVFGKGIEMWLNSQGDYIQIL